MADLLEERQLRRRARGSTSPRSPACCCSSWRSSSRRRCSCGSRAGSCRACSRARCIDLRQEVEAKLNRLPLPYFDNQPRGEILSRVTNDIDNVGQSLQQTLSQLLNSLLTVIAVLGMMFWISWSLALIALVTHPDLDRGHGHDRQALAEAVRPAVAQHRRAQRHRRGDLHRARPRQGLRPPEGDARRSFKDEERRAVRAPRSGRSSSAASSCRS